MSELIIEAVDETHIMHPEEYIMSHGIKGAVRAGNILNSVRNNPNVTIKFDGSPSIMFGPHPETGKFFVSTKSFFNKNPKVNYTHDDIKENHGDTPGLAKVLHTALDLLSTENYDKVYRGDVMHHGDVKVKRGNVILQPNVVKYSVPEDTYEGNKLKASKLSIALHTEYAHDGNNMMSKSLEELPKEPNGVYFISGKVEAPKIEDEKVDSDANALHNKIKNSYGSINDLDKHTDHLKMFINHTYKNDIAPFAESYIEFLNHRKSLALSKYKTPVKKDEVNEHYTSLVNHVKDNRDKFNNLFDLHRLTTRLKHSLISNININNAFLSNASINNEPGHEGFVLRHNGIHKLVNRNLFAKANFNRERNGN